LSWPPYARESTVGDAKDPAVLQPGSVFAGHYQIIRLLGEGERKQTYLAKDTLLPRQVALALIKPEAARLDPEGTQREADALARAGTHDNVVTFHDGGIVDGTEYLVFDYLPGGTLRALELAPFVRVLAGQMGQDACYFYNRLEGAAARWVSYYFHAEPELVLPDEDLFDLLDKLAPAPAIEHEATHPRQTPEPELALIIRAPSRTGGDAVT
jgi:serine/threonine protein kinase